MKMFSCKMTSIEVRCAVKSYDRKTFVLNGLNLTVQKGSIYSLIGASGCGKTTLLSCILGMKQLEKGTIKVFGQEVSFERPSKFSHIIGYMPQETGLVPELTIFETLQYFGNIFQMDTGLLKKRARMICELLDLKNPHKLVEKLSGGEKRRVSLAAVIIHDPKILILDEPTVGLDSLLREKIWNFLIETTRTSSLSVIITTHYIAEAEKSNCCGLMRHGILLAEEPPQNIIQKFGVSSFDEAFLSLCLSQQKRENFVEVQGLNVLEKNSIELENFNVDQNVQDEKVETIDFDERKVFCKQTLAALLQKELIRIKRQPAEILFIFIFPICQIFCFAFAIGINPIGLKLGVVNEEISDSNLCSKYLMKTNYTFSNDSCYFENLSCYFLQAIPESTATKVFYNSFDEAFRDVKGSKTIGFLTIASNFTKAMSERKQNWEAISEEFTDKNLIGIYMDQVNPIITSFLQYRLAKAFEKFNKNMLKHCNLNELLEDTSMNMDEGLYYGKFEDDYTITLMPGLFAQCVMLGGILFSISSIAQSRIEGIWNRTIVAGVKTSEILTVFIFIFIITDILQIITLKLAVMYFYDLKIIGNEWLIGLFSFAISMVGSSIGLFISILTNNLLIINTTGLVTFFSCGMLCGSFWPIESQPAWMRYISYTLPTTLPSASIRNILAKGFTFSHPTVYGGFIIICCWLTAMLVLCFITLQRRKFTENSR